MNKAKLRTRKKGQKISIELTVKEYERLLEDLDDWKRSARTTQPKRQKRFRYHLSTPFGK